MLPSHKCLLALALAVAPFAVAAPEAPPVDPVAWTPPTPPERTGLYVGNDRLSGIERIADVGLVGPETISIGPDQRLYTGYVGGQIMSFARDGSDPKMVANTGGRPLGLHHLRDGSLIVADSTRGLLHVGLDGAVKVLTAQYAGTPLRSIDDVAMAADEGAAYFTDASAKFAMEHYTADILEHGGHGRVFRYDMHTGETTLLCSGLNFANGIVLAPDGASLLINETGAYRVMRHWLTGPKAGSTEVFADNLPGYPDNISFNGRDRIWVALVKPRVPLLDRIGGPRPIVRKIISYLPDNVLSKVAGRVSQAIALDLNGQVVDFLQDKADHAFAMVTTVVESDGWLYFGSLAEGSIGRMPYRSQTTH